MHKLIQRLQSASPGPLVGAVLSMVVLLGVFANVAVRSVERDLPETLLAQIGDLTNLVQNLGEVLTAVEAARGQPEEIGLDPLLLTIHATLDQLAQIRSSYKLDNLVHASAMHATVAPAMFDARTWLTAGVGDYPPTSDVVLRLTRQRVAKAYGQAKEQLLVSQRAAQEVLTEQRRRLDDFLHGLNLLLAVLGVLALAIIYLLVIHERVLKARRQAEDALRSSEFRYWALFEGSVQPITIFDQQGRVLLANPATARLFEAAPEALNGRPITELLPETGTAWLQRFESAVTSGKPLFIEEDVALPAGRFHFWSAVRPLADAAGRADGIQVISYDMTERKRAERDLLAAKNAAEAANNAKSRFLAQMSHELRTPLHGILGMTELLLDDTLSPDKAMMAETIRSSGWALSSIIDDILDFTRIKAAKVRISSLEFDLRNLVDEVVLLLAAGARQKGLRFDYLFSAQLPARVAGDPLRLRQILVNLIDNAIKFTDCGSVRLSVRPGPERRLPQSVTVVFTVADTGIGIAESAQARIFDPFAQEDESMTRRHGGTGLGLAICRDLAALMGGGIALVSTPGKGSAFRLDVPFEGRIGAPEGNVAASPDTGTGAPRFVALVAVTDPFEAQALGELVQAAGGRAEMVAEAALVEAAMTRAVDMAERPARLILAEGDLLNWLLARRDQGCPALATARLLQVGDTPAANASADPAPPPLLQRPATLSRLLELLPETGPAPTRQPVSAAARAFRRRRVLLAEDNPFNRVVAERMLQNLGCQVDVAETGAVALGLVQRHVYDAVFMDGQMAGMDGYEAAYRIRAWEAAEGRPRLPIIALTASALDADRERSLASGMDAHLAKPFRQEDLARLLDRWLPDDDAGPNRADRGVVVA